MAKGKTGKSGARARVNDATQKSIEPTHAGSKESIPVHRLHVWQIQAVRDVWLVAGIVGIVLLGYALRTVTVPLLVALLFAYLCEPLIRHMTDRTHRPLSRVQAVSMLLMSMGVVFVLSMALVTPLVVGQTVKLVNSYSDGSIRTRATALSEYVPGFAREDFGHLLEILPEAVQQRSTSTDGIETETEQEVSSDSSTDSKAGQGAIQADQPLTREEVTLLIEERLRATTSRGEGSALLSFAGSGLTALGHFITSGIEIALLFFLIPFYFFFFSVGYPRILDFGRRLLPERNREETIRLIAKMDQVVSGFVRGRIVICFITGVLLAIGWWVVGVPYALVIGMLAGAFFLVPYLGTIALPLALGSVLFHQLGQTHDSTVWWIGALGWPTLIFVFAVVMENYVLTPKIAGKATNLDPVTVIVAVLAGGSLLGVYGMLLSIPLAACIKILITEVWYPKIDAWIKGERSDPLPIE